MFTKVDKMWVSGLVSFLALTAMQFFNVEIDATLQAGIVAVITAALTWLVPNKA